MDRTCTSTYRVFFSCLWPVIAPLLQMKVEIRMNIRIFEYSQCAPLQNSVLIFHLMSQFQLNFGKVQYGIRCPIGPAAQQKQTLRRF